MLDIIRKAWGWIGLDPADVVAENAFGNLIVRAADGAFWRIRPEDLSCEKVAGDRDEFAVLSRREDFLLDWEMTRLVEQARRKLGRLPAGRCYCLKVPAVLGGRYDAANMDTISLAELISFSGDLAEQLKDVPDGTKVRLRIVP